MLQLVTILFFFLGANDYSFFRMFTGAIARSRAFFGQGSGTIVLDNVQCAGTETRLIDCPANPIGIHNCAHSEDAGVTCTPVLTAPPNDSML